MFWATEKSTGKFFMATVIVEPENLQGKMPREPIAGESYLGHLFPGVSTSNGPRDLTVYARGRMKSQILKASELEELNAKSVRFKVQEA